MLRNVEKSSFRGVLGINIGKNFDTPIERAADDYLACLDAVYGRATYVAVNISSPNTKNLRDLQSKERLDELLAAIVARRDALAARTGSTKPLAVKIAPDLDDEQIAAIAELALKHRIDALIATNTTIGAHGRRGPSPRAARRAACPGAPCSRSRREVLRKLSRLLAGRIPLIGVGGDPHRGRRQGEDRRGREPGADLHRASSTAARTSSPRRGARSRAERARAPGVPCESASRASRRKASAASGSTPPRSRRSRARATTCGRRRRRISASAPPTTPTAPPAPRSSTPAEAWAAELVVKVKEIQPGEWTALVRGSTLFSFQHLVGEPALAREVAARGITAIAYEMVRDAAGGFPLLAPMSVIAGRLAIQVGAQLLTLPAGGNGTLLAGCPGAEPARVLVLGGGHAGTNAAQLAARMGAKVVVLTRSAATRDAVAARLGPPVEVGLATPEAIDATRSPPTSSWAPCSSPGSRRRSSCPARSSRACDRGSVIVDISIDAGGVAETSRPTTHADPTFVEEGVVHYCVANMPSAVARASAAALSAAALPYVRSLAGKGVARAVRDDDGLRAGVLLWRGRFTHEGIAAEAGRPYSPLTDGDLA